MDKRKLLGNTILIFTSVIWGLGFSWQRVGMESIGPVTFTVSRMLISAIAVGLVAWILSIKVERNISGLTGEVRAAHRKYTLLGGICCGTFLSFATLFQQTGIVYTTAGKAGFITAMYMLFVPILNFLLFKKKNSWLVWLAVFIGVGGMYLLCVKEDFSLTLGDMLVCICALMFSGHILCCDYFVKRVNPIELAAIQFTTSAIVSAGIAFSIETPHWAGILSAAVPILYCGVVSGGIGYTLQIVAQKFTDPTIASLLMSLESVFAVIAGALLLGEQMSSRELLGCVVMFTATILVQIPLPERGET